MKRGFANESHAPASVEWYTPKYVFDGLGLRFDLDPAAPHGGGPHVPADSYYTKDDDGLSRPWFGRVWLNPPYGRGLDRWVERMASHGNGVMLVLSRTDTAWFRRAAEVSSLFCFIRGRIRHIPGPGSATTGRPQVGSMLFGFGAECEAAIERSGLGTVVRVVRR